MGLYMRPRPHARLQVVSDTAGRCRGDVYVYVPLVGAAVSGAQ